MRNKNAPIGLRIEKSIKKYAVHNIGYCVAILAHFYSSN